MSARRWACNLESNDLLAPLSYTTIHGTFLKVECARRCTRKKKARLASVLACTISCVNAELGSEPFRTPSGALEAIGGTVLDTWRRIHSVVGKIIGGHLSAGGVVCLDRAFTTAAVNVLLRSSAIFLALLLCRAAALV